MLNTYAIVENQEVLPRDSHTITIGGIGNVELKFSFGNTVVLKDVLHPPEIKMNLVLGFLLYKAGFTQVIGVDLYTLTYKGMFVGKSYASERMFKLNVESNKITSFTFLLCDFNI